MARVNKFCIPGAIILFIAFALLFFASISLPRITGLDIVRFEFQTPISQTEIAEFRIGIWAECLTSSIDNILPKGCTPSQHAYNVVLPQWDGTTAGAIFLSPAWTRGLVIHPVACGVTFIAFLLSLFPSVAISLVASLMAFLASLVTLIAFACDIALLVKVKNVIHDNDSLLSRNIDVKSGPAFWLTFVSIILLLISGCTVCFGRGRLLEDARPTYSTRKGGAFWTRFQMTRR